MTLYKSNAGLGWQQYDYFLELENNRYILIKDNYSSHSYYENSNYGKIFDESYFEDLEDFKEFKNYLEVCSEPEKKEILTEVFNENPFIKYFLETYKENKILNNILNDEKCISASAQNWSKISNKKEVLDINSPINFFRKNKESLNWSIISQYQKTDDFLIEFLNYVDWTMAFRHQKLSKNVLKIVVKHFNEESKDIHKNFKIDFDFLFRFQKLSEDFIKFFIKNSDNLKFDKNIIGEYQIISDDFAKELNIENKVVDSIFNIGEYNENIKLKKDNLYYASNTNIGFSKEKLLEYLKNNNHCLFKFKEQDLIFVIDKLEKNNRQLKIKI